MNTKDNTGKNLNREEDDLKIIAPTLFSIEKGNPFSAPKDYFESFPAIIQERCTENNKVNLVSAFFHLLLRHRLITTSLAILIVVASAYLFLFLPEKGFKNNIVASEEYLIEIDEVVLIETLSKSDDHKGIDDIYDKATIDYLLENSIELQTIINEL